MCSPSCAPLFPFLPFEYECILLSFPSYPFPQYTPSPPSSHPGELLKQRLRHALRQASNKPLSLHMIAP